MTPELEALNFWDLPVAKMELLLPNVEKGQLRVASYREKGKAGAPIGASAFLHAPKSARLLDWKTPALALRRELRGFRRTSVWSWDGVVRH
jgi:hypothetical protein